MQNNEATVTPEWIRELSLKVFPNSTGNDTRYDLQQEIRREGFIYGATEVYQRMQPQPLQGIEESDRPCKLSNQELIEKVKDWVSKLCLSGGKDWRLTVPANRNNDPDLLIMEIVDRFKLSVEATASLQSQVETERLGKQEYFKMMNESLKLYECQNRTIIKLQSQVDDLTKERDTVLRQVTSLADENARLQSAVVNLRLEINDLKLQLAEKNREMNKLKRENEQLKK